MTFVYDSLSNPVQETHSFSDGTATYVVAVAYDKRSAPVRLAYPSGAAARIERDERGLPVAFDYGPGTGTFDTVATCEYDAAGRLSDAALGNGVGMTRNFDSRSLELGRTYVAGQGVALDVTNGTAATAYDNRGNLLGETVTGAIAASAQTSRAFAYDQRDRLTNQEGAGTDDASWTLDRLGNWTSVTEAGVPESRSVSLDNEYTVVDGANASHDENGNLTGLSGHQFVYDWADRLVRVDIGGTTVASFGYDALGRRVVRTAGGVVTRYVHSGSQVVEEYEDSGVGFSLARRYVLGPGLDQPILMDKRRGTGLREPPAGGALGIGELGGHVAHEQRRADQGTVGPVAHVADQIPGEGMRADANHRCRLAPGLRRRRHPDSDLRVTGELGAGRYVNGQ